MVRLMCEGGREMKKTLSILLIVTILLSQIIVAFAVSADTTCVKNEFRIIADGNEKDVTSSVIEYTESELKYGDLQGETKTSSVGNKTVRVLKNGQANIFRIEIDKEATKILINDFKIDSADGELYQYHFYLGDNPNSLNVIGSYDGSMGRSVREHGDNFSWNTVDQGWIRAQNNKDIVSRAPLNDDCTKKVVYLKLSAKGGNSENNEDIDPNAQISYVSFVVQTVVPTEVVETERKKGGILDEYRIIADGNEKDSSGHITEFTESELKYGDLQGETQTSVAGNKTVRTLKNGQVNVFKLEINKNATAIQINDFKIDSADGELYQYHFYLSDDPNSFNIIGSYDGAAGRSVKEHGDNFSWSTVDQGWIRAQNNKDIIARAPLNEDGTKKIVYLKLSAKGGNSENAEDIDHNAEISYVSFVVQSLCNEETSFEPENPPQDETPVLKEEFRVLTNGNTKNADSKIPEYFEDELKSKDLEGELKESTVNVLQKVRILKAGQANTFRIEIDKNATEILVDNFVINSADGSLYQYHFYLSDDNTKFNIIGSYDGGNGRNVREDGEAFSWFTVDQGWIRAQNNKEIVERASLNEDGTKKVLYLKLSSKGGNSETAEDIDQNAEISYVSFVVKSMVIAQSDEEQPDGPQNPDTPEDPDEPENPEQPENPDKPQKPEVDNAKEEFRVLANGNTKDLNSKITEYFEDELKSNDLEGELKDSSVNALQKVRVLKAGQANTFRIEIDKHATEILIDDFVLNSADGNLYQYHFYLSDDGKKFNIIGSYDGSNGRNIREDGETFSWNTVDKGWIRSQNNKDIVARALLNEDGTKKVLYLKLSAKGGNCEDPEDIDKESEISYVSFVVKSIVEEKKEEPVTKAEDNTPNVKHEFTVLANGNIKDSASKVTQYFEDELKTRDLEGEIKTSTVNKNQKVRVLKAGQSNIFRIEIDKQAVALRINNFYLNSADGKLYQYHFYISDDNSKFNIIGSYDGSNGRSIRESGDNFAWITVDQTWIRAQNNKEILERATLNEKGDKKVVYLMLSSKGGDCENPNDIDKNAELSYVSFDVETVIDPNYTYVPPTTQSPGVVPDENSFVNTEFTILANGNTKSDSGEIPQYLEDELKVGELEGEIKTSLNGKEKVRVLKAGQANTFRIEISKYATAVMLNNFKLYDTDGELYQYHFYISDDGEMFNIIGSYNGAGGRSTRETGETFKWDKVDQGWIRAENNTTVVSRAPLNEAGDKKVIYLRLSAKGGDSQDPKDIDENAQIAYISFDVQSIVDTSKMTGTEISALRLDASLLKKYGISNEEWKKQEEFYSVYQYLNNHIADSDFRVESGNIWSEIQVIGEEKMLLVAGKEGYITYNIDLEDTTRNFEVECFGRLRGVKLLASKDGGKEWYLIGEVGDQDRGILGEYNFTKSNDFSKTIEWLLTGNKEKKFQLRLQALGEESILEMVNLVIYQEYVTDSKYAEELPEEMPENYQKPANFKLLLTETKVETKPKEEKNNPFAIVAVVISSVLMLSSLGGCILTLKKHK